MYRFTTKDGQHARVDPTQVRSILPSGSNTGYSRLVLDGGHSVVVEGDVERIHDILNDYRLHPRAPLPTREEVLEALKPATVGGCLEHWVPVGQVCNRHG